MKILLLNCITKIAGLIVLFSCLFIPLHAQQSQEKQPEPHTPVQTVYLYADASDLNRLFSRNPRSDARVNGFVRLEPRGRVQALDGGFRFRGNTSRYHPRKSFNIRFAHPQHFLFNGRHLNLNALYTDPSALRERLAWDMFHEVNRPASKTRYVGLFINDSFEGLGLHIQRVDELLLRQNGLDPNGTLVRDMTRRNNQQLGIQRRSIFGYDLRLQQDQADFLAKAFESRWSPDYATLAELIHWVYNTPAGDDFYEGFNARFDVDVFIDWLGIHYLFGDVDAFGDDYWLYRGRSSDSKWMPIPWDHDLSFGKNEREGLTPNRELGQYGRGLVQLSDFFAYEYPIDDAGWDNALISKFLETPQLVQLLHTRMLFLMDEIFTPMWFSERITQLHSVTEPFLNHRFEPAFRFNERQHHGEKNRLDEHLENLMDFIYLRYAFLRKQMEVHEVHEVYSATAEVSPSEKQLFTDSTGWTIAWMYSSNGQATVRIHSEAASLENAIQQEWTIEVTGTEIEGELSLFYRNDIAPDGKANWYLAPEAIGNQRNLKMLINGNAQPTRVNPYSNKATAQITLPAGTHVVRLVSGG